MKKVDYLSIAILLMLLVETGFTAAPYPYYSLIERPVYEKQSDAFKYETADHRNSIKFSLRMIYNPDMFLDTRGILLNLGAKAESTTQKNILRSWFNHVIPSFGATLEEDLHLFLAPDFGQNQQRLYDASIDLDHYRMFGFTAGLQKSLVAGFEQLTYPSLAYEGFTSNLAPNREIGFMMHGGIGPQRPHPYKEGWSFLGLDDWFSYQFGIFNGAPDASNPGIVPFNQAKLNGTFTSQYLPSLYNTRSKAFEGRVFFNPFIAQENTVLQNLGFGIAFSTQIVNNSQDLPDILSIGQNPIFTYGVVYFQVYTQGLRNRIHPQAVWYRKNFGVMADWTQTLQHIALYQNVLGTPNYNELVLNRRFNSSIPNYPAIAQYNQASQIQFLYNITGEEFQIDGIKPENNFKPMDFNSMGALQLVFRFSSLNMDPSVFWEGYDYETPQNKIALPVVSVQKANTYAIGLNWYLNPFIKMTTEFSDTKFTGGCSTGSYNDPVNPGCLTANSSYIGAPGSVVINRPDELVFLQRILLEF